MVCRTGRFDSMTEKRRLSVLLDGSLGRLREGWPFVAEATAAATAAWIIDTRFLGQPRPFFAPAAALIVLGQVRRQRLLRAVEVVLVPHQGDVRW
jgi:hypothetical protein